MYRARTLDVLAEGKREWRRRRMKRAQREAQQGAAADVQWRRVHMPGWHEQAQNAAVKHLDSLDIHNNYEYADNFRFARVGHPEDEQRYKAISKKGCCGFYDQEINTPHGPIRVGFNYGH